MMDTPFSRYEQDMSLPGFQVDHAQRVAVQRLQRLYDELVARQSICRQQSLWSKLRSLSSIWPLNSKGEAQFIQGVYLWGGVGRGKTYLMDVFFDTLPFENKLRTHFHRFMRRIHGELALLEGEENPLELVAEKISKEASVICFDEFFVSDITDAMILSALFKALFKRSVVLVATSNIIPDGLYKDGLQRVKFLPAIKLINLNTDVINVDGGIDYRLRALANANLYHCPLDASAEIALQKCFKQLSPDQHITKKDTKLEVEGRVIKARYESDDVVWFDFIAICDGPRSQNDYIVLAKEYHAVVVSGVPSMGRANDDQARRFVNMVDEFYDRRVKLVISSSEPLKTLYGEGKLKFEFDRTISRLLEMQSEEYLALAHRP